MTQTGSWQNSNTTSIEMDNQCPVIFRADGNSRVGLGHVMRSLAVADMLKNEYECHFAIISPDDTLKKEILDICSRIIIIKETHDFVVEIIKYTQDYPTPPTIVLDGYQFDTAYQKQIKNIGVKVICIDDIHAYHFVADAVINHAPEVLPHQYSIEPYTKLCLGTNYALLRRPFLEAAKVTRHIDTIKHVFICLGGADKNNLTLQVLMSLVKDDSDIETINIVLGSSNKHKAEIDQFCNKDYNVRINCHHNLKDHEMCMLMQDNDVAIVSASGILFEVLAVKMPVIAGHYVDNQKNIYNGFKKFGLIIGVEDLRQDINYLALINQISASNIKSTLKLQAQYFNGSSQQSILNLFEHIISDSKLELV